MTDRQWRIGVTALPAVAAVAAVVAALAGQGWPGVVVAAGCTTAGVAGVALVTAGETLRWPARPARERTSAGWHEVRLLAAAMTEATTDPSARARLVARIDAAVGEADVKADHTIAPHTSRRDFERALARLRAMT